MSTDPTDTADTMPPPPPFSTWLAQQRQGATHGELTDGMAELAAAVMATGKGGSLTLTIKIAPATKNGGHQMVVADAVTVKAPKANRTESIFFFDETTGALTRNDPLQPELPLREVPAPDRTHLKEA